MKSTNTKGTGYFDTTNLPHKELMKAIANASSQAEKIEIFFKRNPQSEFTPFEVHRALFDESTPITSTRRAMNTLTENDVLYKLDKQREGDFGRMNNCWKLKQSPVYLQTEMF